MEWQADKLGYDIIIQFTDEEVRVPACVENQKVAGIIIVGAVEKDRIEALSVYGIPVVVVDSTTYGYPADLSRREPSDPKRLPEDRLLRGS